MMGLALTILCIPGIMVNNLVASGMITTQGCTGITAPTGFTIQAYGGSCISCPASSTTLNPVCTIINPVGCQANQNYCTFQNSAISFLNSCSPFTNVLTLNFVGFVSSFFTNCGVGTSQTLGQNFTQQNLPGGNQNITISGCTPSSLPLQAQGINQYSCTATSSTIGNTVLPYIVLFGSAVGPNFWNGVIGNSTVGSVPTFATVNFEDSSSNINTFSALCLTYGTYYGSVGNANNKVTSLVCNTFSNAGQLAPNTANNVLSPSTLLSFALTLIGGLLVVFIGLGIYIQVGGSVLATGLQSAFGSNPQGTRQAFTFGVAMLVWFPLYSEFNTWFNSGILPYGLDGLTGIVSIGLIALFFIGTFALSQTGSSGESSGAGASNK